MKNLYCCLAVFLLIGLTFPLRAMDKRLVEVPISEAPAYAKYALVVGVTDYDVCPTLHVCGNDAKEFAELLKTKFGFTDVVLMTDMTALQLADKYGHHDIAVLLKAASAKSH